MSYRVRIRVGQVEIEAESNQQEFVESKIAELTSRYLSQSAANGFELLTSKTGRKESLGEFIAKVKPKSATEYAVTIAFFFERIEGVNEITLKEIRESFRKVKFSHSNPSQALVDAKSQNLLMEGSAPKSYTLTKLGLEMIENRLKQNLENEQ